MSLARGTVRRVLRWIAVTVPVVLCGAGAVLPVSSGGEIPTHRIYHGQALPLDLDTTRLAVRYRTDSTTAARASALDAATLAISSSEPIGIGEWHIVTLESPAADPAETALGVETLAGSSEIDFVSPVFSAPNGGWMAITPDVLVRVRPELVHAADGLLQALAPEMEIVDDELGGLPGAFRLRSAHRSGFEVLAQANSLATDPRIEWAEPDMIVTGRGELTPNDPGFGLLWGIRNTAQFGGVPGMDIDADLAWDVTMGSPDVKVLVLDTGVQQDHPDLNLLPGADFTSDPDAGGGPFNVCDRHGTPVAGCVSAVIDNNLGTVGVAPGSPVLSARTFISTGACNDRWVAQFGWTAEALEWGAQQGARVSNNSNFYDAPSMAIEDMYDATYEDGMIHFAAAGNSAIDRLEFPASLPRVNAVSAIHVDGLRASFSNYSNRLSVTAPGTNIYTTDRTGSAGYVPGDYVFFAGTSAASPYAAGVAALILSADPSLSSTMAEHRLRCHARDLGPAGFDPFYGHGLVNAHDAVLGEDSDHDSLDDTCDNCPATHNPDQEDDVHPNEIGDLCDDPDGDGIADAADNCPDYANLEQEDRDLDGSGDLCDICPDLYNPDQEQTIACIDVRPGGSQCLEADISLLTGEPVAEMQLFSTAALSPTRMTFNLYTTSCFQSQAVQIFLNDVLIGTFIDPAATCSCLTPVRSFTVDDASLLDSAWRASETNTFTIRKAAVSGSTITILGWLAARIQFGSDETMACLYDARNGDCTSTTMCNGATPAAVDSMAEVAPFVGFDLRDTVPFPTSQLPGLIDLGNVPDGHARLCVAADAGGAEASDCVSFFKSGETALAINGADCGPPRADAGEDLQEECTSPAGALVVLDGSGSEDASSTPSTNDDIVLFEWFEDFGMPSEIYLGDGEVREVPLSLGSHVVTLRVTDSFGATNLDEVLVTVVDTAPPAITVILDPPLLWPPNHRMVPVAAQVSASDLCGATGVMLVSVASDEPDDAPDGSDGSTTHDIQGDDLGSADFDLYLRAERSGTGEGRTYSVGYTTADTSGNVASSSSEVFVPHDVGGSTEPLMISLDENPSGTVLAWDLVAGALFYDVVRGNVKELRDENEFFHLGRLTCIASGLTGTTTDGIEDGKLPRPGESFYYLVQYNDGLPSGYGTAVAAKDLFAPPGQGCP